MLYKEFVKSRNAKLNKISLEFNEIVEKEKEKIIEMNNFLKELQENKSMCHYDIVQEFCKEFQLEVVDEKFNEYGGYYDLDVIKIHSNKEKLWVGFDELKEVIEEFKLYYL